MIILRLPVKFLANAEELTTAQQQEEALGMKIETEAEFEVDFVGVNIESIVSYNESDDPAFTVLYVEGPRMMFVAMKMNEFEQLLQESGVRIYKKGGQGVF